MSTVNITENPIKAIGAGVLGGIVGGIVFALMMFMAMPNIVNHTIPTMMGLTPQFDGNLLVALMIHGIISIIYGIIIGLVILVLSKQTGKTEPNFIVGLVVGIVIGIIAWIIGPLMIMPMMLGGQIFTIDNTAIMSLVGHIVYGFLAGIVVILVLLKV